MNPIDHRYHPCFHTERHLRDTFRHPEIQERLQFLAVFTSMEAANRGHLYKENNALRRRVSDAVLCPYSVFALLNSMLNMLSHNSKQQSTQRHEHNVFYYSQLRSLPCCSYGFSPECWSEYCYSFGTFSQPLVSYITVLDECKSSIVATACNPFSTSLWHNRGHQQNYFPYVFKAHFFKRYWST